MIELLLSRPVIVALAVLGALLSTVASFAQVRKAVSDKSARVLNLAGYASMAVSILLFIVAGLLS
ncbi:MAG: hypothetical protein EPO20_08120 [Betaproteobacteria bacterium]|nr:MAG: hypothetical protein EPO20_08120 [Betaproteobacteria bacterium]